MPVSSIFCCGRFKSSGGNGRHHRPGRASHFLDRRTAIGETFHLQGLTFLIIFQGNTVAAKPCIQAGCDAGGQLLASCGGDEEKHVRITFFRLLNDDRNVGLQRLIFRKSRQQKDLIRSMGNVVPGSFMVIPEKCRHASFHFRRKLPAYIQKLQGLFPIFRKNPDSGHLSLPLTDSALLP